MSSRARRINYELSICKHALYKAAHLLRGYYVVFYRPHSLVHGTHPLVE